MAKALVTGAGVRLGRATALALARAGYDLYLHSRDSALDEVAKEVRALGREATLVHADLTGDLQAFTPIDTLDLLVNNAGIFEPAPFRETSREQLRRLHALNAEAPYFLTQMLLPALERAPAPCVVNITDVLVERGEPGLSAYTMSKAALIALTKTLAVELAPRVRVNAVSPGAVLLPEAFTPADRERALAPVPLRREGRADDVADAVVYLASAAYVSGCILNVDGGRLAR